MTGYYNLLTKIKEHFDSDALVNTVTQGDIFEVDLISSAAVQSVARGERLLTA
jgi:hypothetical protein